MNTLNNKEKGENLQENIGNIKEQREALLIANPDKIYGVYNLVENKDGSIVFEEISDVMCCYPNQYENLKGLDENPDIGLLNLGTLRKGNIDFLNKYNGSLEGKKPTLLSNGVIEYYIDKNGETRFPTTIRDDGAVDAASLTTVAGRNSETDLDKEAMREYAEESPFLGKNKNGEYCLYIPDVCRGMENDTKASVKFFLENKYNLDRNDSNNLKSINFAEKTLGVKYEELGKILQDIVENNRIEYFETEDGSAILPKTTVTIKDKDGQVISTTDSYVFFDEGNNTVEYRKVKKMKIPTNFDLNSRLFLESQNQGAKNLTAEELKQEEKVTPTVDKFLKELITITNDTKAKVGNIVSKK